MKTAAQVYQLRDYNSGESIRQPKALLILLDKLLILLIYLNVLAPTFDIGSVRLSKALFAVIIVFYLVIMMSAKLYVPRMAIVYISATLIGVTTLIFASVSMANDISDVMGLAGIFLFVLIIPAMLALAPVYGLERYVFHSVVATVLLAIVYITIYVLCGPFGLKQISDLLTGEQNPLASMVSIAFFPGGVRISLTNGGFLPPTLAILFCWLLKKTRFFVMIAFLLVAMAIYLSYTISLWGGAIVGLVMVALLLRGTRRGTKWRVTKVLFGGACVAVSCLISGGLPEFIVGSKRESAEFKTEQFKEALDIYVQDPILGRGLGHTFRTFEIKSIMGSETLLFENSYATLIASTGMLGLIVFGFAFGYYLIIYFVGARYDPLATSLAVAQIAILIQAIGNPYLWSGGLALFFICLLATRLAFVRAGGILAPAVLRSQCTDRKS